MKLKHLLVCNFDMCKECTLVYYEHSQTKTILTCYLGHILLYFPDIQSLVVDKNYENACCRLCSQGLEGPGFHCVVCMYSICDTCKRIHEESGKNKVFCKKAAFVEVKTKGALYRCRLFVDKLLDFQKRKTGGWVLFV